MKKIVFLSSEDLLDVDLPVVKELNESYKEAYHLIWVIILKGYGWYKKEDLISRCEQHNIAYQIFEQKEKLKNPLNILFHLNILSTLKKMGAYIIYDSYLGVPYMHFFRGFFLKKKTWVIAIHDVEQHYKMKNKFIRTFYYSFLMRTYTNFHIFSRHQLRIFNEHYPGKNPFFSPLFLKDFGPLPVTEKSADKNITYFLFFGIIRANKGLDMLIQAADILEKKYDNFHIIIAGKCDNWAEYSMLIKNKTRFTNIIRNIEQSEVPALFAKAHFMMLPYRDVTQSGVLLTGYNYHIPAIASELEGFSDYIDHGKTGYLFEAGNVTSLASQMESALKLSQLEYDKIVDDLKTYISEDISIGGISKKYVDFFNTL